MDSNILTAIIALLTAIVTGVIAPLTQLFVWYVQRKLGPKESLETASSSTPSEAVQPPAARSDRVPAAERSVPTGAKNDRSICVVGRSTMFYWWPVWSMGFLFAVLTFLDGSRLAIVPAGARVEATSSDDRFLLVLPSGVEPPDSLKDAAARSAAGREAFAMRGSRGDRPYGILFVFILVAVLTMTHVPLRGNWSIAAIVALVAVSLAMAYFNVWDAAFDASRSIGVQISPTGYLFLSTAVFSLWLATFYFVDPARRLLVGPDETVVIEPDGTAIRFPTNGAIFEKRQDDLFLHWQLGFGSGDLTVRAPGPGDREFRFDNVLFIGKKMSEIVSMIEPGSPRRSS